MSQLAFLRREWPEVFEAAAKAEGAARADPRTACFYARRALELLVSWAYKHDPGLRLPYQDNLSALIHEPSFKQTAGEAVFSKARVINTLGNRAVHSHRAVPEADGLAAGKGVVVCDGAQDAERALRSMLLERKFGAAGATVLVEQRLAGREVSVLAFSDGRSVALMPPARDHKRVGDGDQGPNTGGMGAYSRAPVMTDEMTKRTMDEIVMPTMRAMSAMGAPYKGVLFAG